MTKLTDIQHAVLTQAAQAEGGAIDSPEQDRRAIAGLIKRGFFIALPQSDGPTRLLITEAGRAAIAPPAPDDQEAALEPANTPAETAPAPLAIEPEASRPEELSGEPESLADEPQTPAKPKGKVGAMVDLLRQPDGANLEALMEATGWQAHSVRGALSGAIKKGLGLTVVSEKVNDIRRYRIPAEVQG